MRLIVICLVVWVGAVGIAAAQDPAAPLSTFVMPVGAQSLEVKCHEPGASFLLGAAPGKLTIKFREKSFIVSVESGSILLDAGELQYESPQLKLLRGGALYLEMEIVGNAVPPATAPAASPIAPPIPVVPMEAPPAVKPKVPPKPEPAARGGSS